MYRNTRYPMNQPMVHSGMGMAPFFKVTVFEQEHFQGKCQEFTSECCNIQECGLDNIRSIRVESGAWVGFEHNDFQGSSSSWRGGEYPHWDSYSGSLSSRCPPPPIRSPQSHQSSRMMIFEKENFLGRSVEMCDDYPSLQAMGWMKPEVGSMHVQCGAFVCYQFPGYRGQQYIMECERRIQH
uniref:Beta/gamma crystallin 'Greek key' domain-containing protein n=1 Tax=Gadus morhua TaxID=8049 RepID=A0A8C4ZRU4_GADMO